MKKLLIALTVLVVLMVGLLLAIPLFVPMDKIRAEIESGINAQITGHAEIRDLKLSLFPWIGVRISGVVIKNGDAFKQSELLRVQDAGVHVKLLPLLSKHIVGEINIERPVIRLETLADGRQSQNLLMKAKAAAAPAAPVAPAKKSDAMGALMAGAEIRSLIIKDAELRALQYNEKGERKGGNDISHVNVKIQNLAWKGRVPAELSAAVFNDAKPDVAFKGLLVTDVDLNKPEQNVVIEQSTLKLGDIDIQIKGKLTKPAKNAAVLDITADSKNINLSRIDDNLPPLKGKVPKNLKGDLSFQAKASGSTDALRIALTGESKIIEPGLEQRIDLQNTSFDLVHHNNLLTINHFETHLLGGSFKTTGTVGTNDRHLDLELVADKIDLNQANNTFGKTKDLVHGLCDVKAHAEGTMVAAAPGASAGMVPSWLRSRGTLHIGKGKITNLNLLGDTVKVLLKIAPLGSDIQAMLSKHDWESVDAKFSTDQGVLTLAPAAIDYGSSMVSAIGTIAPPDNTLSFKGIITLRKGTVAKMGGSFPGFANKAGEMEIPYRVNGTLSKPLTYPDVLSLGKKALASELNKIVTPEMKNSLKDLTNLIPTTQSDKK